MKMNSICKVNQNITDKFKHLDDVQYHQEYDEHCRKMSIIDSYEEEINRLKVILKDVKLTAEWHIEDCACFHPMSEYQLGWFEAMNLIKEKVGK